LECTTCLIAAHDPWTIQLLRVFSKETGLKIIQAFEGQEALKIAKSNPLKLIILEYNLPGELRGWDLLATLQADTDTHNIPVLVLSWQGQGMNNPNCETDTISFLQDPVSYDEFVMSLRNMGVTISPIDEIS